MKVIYHLIILLFFSLFISTDLYSQNIIKDKSINDTIVQNINRIEVYPNPCTSDFKIRFGNTIHPGTEYELVNITGQVALKKTIKTTVTNEVFVDVSTLHKGVYFLKITIGTSQELKRIIIQ